MPLYEMYKRGGCQAAPLDSRPSPQRIAIASAGSAAAVSCLTFPLEVVRLRLQAQEMSSGSGLESNSSASQQRHQRYTGMLDAFRSIIKNEGVVRGLYRGLSSSLIRTIPNSMVIMVSYESVLRFTSSLVDSLDRTVG
jgi:solute carrier family 25 (mitochondrial carnitine/acylcarnitine transporter), member 20/29